MDKKNKIDFLSFLRDDSFVEKVRKSEDLENLTRELTSKYPENEKHIVYAIEFVKLNLINKQKLDKEDYHEILKNIQSHQHLNKRAERRSIFINRIWKAAILIVAISISGLTIYKQMNDTAFDQLASNNGFSDNDQAVIILSDGSSKTLQNNDSYIKYNKEDGEVIVQNDSKVIDEIENKVEQTDAILNQVIVPYGQRHKVELSDGTIVQLNAGSKLAFPANFTGKTREVYLIGEAYFEVTKMEKKPFIVKTDNIDIKVLGTTFNIAAYSDEKTTSTVLLEGKVKVIHKDRLIGNKEFYLRPGQGCFHTISENSTTVKEVDTYQYVSWKDGLFQFKDMALLDVVRRVKKYYNKPIQIEGELFAKTLVSGKLVLSEDFNEVMEYLSKTVEGRYCKKDNGIFILKR